MFRPWSEIAGVLVERLLISFASSLYEGVTIVLRFEKIHSCLTIQLWYINDNRHKVIVYILCCSTSAIR
jgi:hypothetical protein